MTRIGFADTVTQARLVADACAMRAGCSALAKLAAPQPRLVQAAM